MELEKRTHLFKRFIGFALVLVMMLQAAPVTALAAGAEGAGGSSAAAEEGLQDDGLPGGGEEAPLVVPEPVVVPETDGAVAEPEEDEPYVFAGGDGLSAATAYVIASPTDLVGLATLVNERTLHESGWSYSSLYYKLGDNINLAETGSNWTPIGDTINTTFNGYFDGNGKTISGLTVNISTTNYAGLFGVLGNGATVKDLTLDGAKVTNTYTSDAGAIATGALAGYSSEATITDIIVTGATVKANQGVVGGLVGVADSKRETSTTFFPGTGSKITGCMVSGTVTGGTALSNYTGGIVGALYGESVIAGCMNTATVSSYRSGGIVGYAGDSTTVKDCMNAGTVTGNYAGGIGCYLIGNATITRSVNYGMVDVYGTKADVLGGIVARIAGNAKITGNVGAMLNIGSAGSYSHRVVGRDTDNDGKKVSTVTMAGNYGYELMKRDNKDYSGWKDSATDVDGAGAVKTQLTSGAFWLGATLLGGADEGVWGITTGGTPYLAAFGEARAPAAPGFTDDPAGPATLNGITMDPTEAAASPSGTLTFTLGAIPAKASAALLSQKVTWAVDSTAATFESFNAGDEVPASTPAVLRIKDDAAEGQFTVTATAVIDGKTKTATSKVTVLPGLTGMILPQDITMRVGAQRTLVPIALPAEAQPNGIRWTSSAGSVATVEETTGKVTAVAFGTATITATAPNGVNASTTVTVVPTAGAEYSVGICEEGVPFDNGDVWNAVVNEKLTGITFVSTPTSLVTWTSTDERVVTVHDKNGTYAMNTPVPGGNANEYTLRANAVGTATLYATTADGLATASLKVMVAAHDDQDFYSELDQYQMKVTESATELYISGTYINDPPDTASFYNHDTETGFTCNNLQFHTENHRFFGVIDLSSSPLSIGEYEVSLFDSRYGEDGGGFEEWATLIVVPVPTQATDYAAMELRDNKATIYTLSEAKSATVNLYNSTSGGKHDAPTGGTVRFDGDVNSAANRLFRFAAGGRMIQVTYTGLLASGEKLKKSYSGTLVMDYGNGVQIPIKGKLTINVNQKQFKLAAKAQTVNWFYYDMSGDALFAPVELTAANAALLSVDWRNGATQPSFVNAVNTSIVQKDGQYLIPILAGTKKVSGTVKLEATIEGWAGQTFPLDVKVTRSYTPAGLKLKSSTAKVFADSTRSNGTAMTLLPKSRKDSLAKLGVTGVSVAESVVFAPGTLLGSLPEDLRNKYIVNEDIYKIQKYYEVSSYNVRTGAFVLGLTAEGKALAHDALPGGKLLLAVSLEDTADTVKIPVTVSVVKSTTKITLKASKTSITLNPNLAGGDSYDVVLSPSMAGLDTESLNLEYKQTAATKKNDVLPSVQVMGNVVRFTAPKGITYYKTYKYKITAPELYTNSKTGKPVPVSVTITVKTQKKDEGRYGSVKPTLSVKGSVNLTTGAGATVTLKPGNTLQRLPDEVVQNFSLGGQTLDDAQRACFTFTRTGDTTWRIGLDYNKLAATDIPMGKYVLVFNGGTLPDGTAIQGTKSVSFTVTASKPKVTQSTKNVTLYKGDTDIWQWVYITLPNNVPPLKSGGRGVTLRESKYSKYYNVYPVNTSKGLYAIEFRYGEDVSPAPGTTTLTLDLWVQGHQYKEGKPTTSIMVKVTAKQPA